MVKKYKDMSFIDHLEELRWTLFRSLLSVLVFATIAFLSKSFVFDTLLFGPTRPDFYSYRMLCKLGAKLGSDQICIDSLNFEIINLNMAGQFMTHITVSITLGFIAAFPYLIWEIWKFVKPGLHDMEIKASRAVLVVSGLLFFVGVLFGYYLLVPFGINFVTTYTISETVLNTFSLENYINFVSMFVLMSGMMFELPVAVYLLAKIGIIDDTLMIEYRKHAVVLIFFIGAVVTPPDVGTMVIVSVPLWILYELSIYVAAIVSRNRLKKAKLEN